LSIPPGTPCTNDFNRSRGSCVSKIYSVLWDYTYHAVTDHLHMFNNVSTITITSSVILCLVVLQVTDVLKESVTICTVGSEAVAFCETSVPNIQQGRGFNCKYVQRSNGCKLRVTLNAFKNVRCSEPSRICGIKGPYSAPMPVLKGYQEKNLQFHHHEKQFVTSKLWSFQPFLCKE